MEWSQEVVFEFLELYESEPIIWMPRHPQHKNRNLVNDAWLRINDKISIECTVPELKKKKESLMVSFRSLWRKVKASSKTGTGSDEIYKPTWFAYEKMESFVHGVSVARNTCNSENWEDSMEDDKEADSLSESESVVSGDAGAGTSTDKQKHPEINEKEDNENVATTSASLNKGGGIGKSTGSNQKQVKVPVGEVKKNKRKAVEIDETERRIDEAYDFLKRAANLEPPTTNLCTAYGQLVAKRLETLSEVNRNILMNEIDNLFFRVTMQGYTSPQYKPVSPGPTSPASFYSSSSDDTSHHYSAPSITALSCVTSLAQNDRTSSIHQRPLNDISSPEENYTFL